MEKEEFIKLLPKLIREDDEVKGAIISALSGVIATKEDIKDVIREFDKRFEAMDKRFEAMDKRFEAMDKRFEALQRQMDKRFEALQRQMDKRFDAMQEQIQMNYDELRGVIDNLGGRAGKSTEKMVLRLLQRYNKLGDIDISKIEHVELIDKKGHIFTEGYRTDVDILIDNGKTILIEIKFKADNRDIYHFVQVSKLYERLHKKPDELWVLTAEITPKNFEVAMEFPVKLIYGKIR